MRVLVSEYLTCGAWDAPPQPSLLREGRAMLCAIALDFARVAGCRVVATWDARLDAPDLPGVEVLRADGTRHEARLFRKLAAECDAALVIAPETGGLLAARRRALDEIGARALGPAVAAIELTADKLRLAGHLASHGIRTVPTRPLTDDLRFASCEFERAGLAPLVARRPPSIVIKPRDGAGSLRTFVVAGPEELERLRGEFPALDDDPSGIVQPFVSGRAVSVAAIVAEEGSRIDLLPVAEQRTGSGPRAGSLRYLGGRVPAAGVDAGPVRQLVRDALAVVPGLAGYVGCDVIVPDDAPHAPVLVEINPRLTTSYLGYRALAEEDLAERILFADRSRPPIRWRKGAFEFDVEGILGR